MSDYWKEQDFGLRFQLSDLTLGRVKLSILGHACSLPEILSARRPEIPFEPPHPYRGYLIRSCPGFPSSSAIERHGSYLAYTMAAYDHCYIELSSTFAEYQAKFSSKFRNTINRKVRKFEAANNGIMRFGRYVTPEELRQFHPLARQVSVLTYQERLLNLGLPGDVQFITRMLDAADCNRVRAFILFVGERPVAYLYCPVENGIVMYAYLGFDPALSELSPGTVLFWLGIKSLFDEGAFTYFDFSEGDSAQKRYFSTGQVPCHNRLFLRRGLGSQLLLRGHYTFDEGSRRAGMFFERLGLKRKIKHFLRGT